MWRGGLAAIEEFGLVRAVSFFLPLTQCAHKLPSTLPPDIMSGANAYE